MQTLQTVYAVSEKLHVSANLGSIYMHTCTWTCLLGYVYIQRTAPIYLNQSTLPTGWFGCAGSIYASGSDFCFSNFF